jgi:hypothetical protein
MKKASAADRRPNIECRTSSIEHRTGFMTLQKRKLGRTGFEATLLGIGDVVLFPVGPFVDCRYVEEILPLARRKGAGTVCFKTFGAGKLLGDTTGYNRPLEARPRGKFSSGGKLGEGSAELPRLSPRECLEYTLTVGPDVALLGLSFPNEQDAAMEAFRQFTPLSAGSMEDVRRRAALAIEGKSPCWWNPPL